MGRISYLLTIVISAALLLVAGWTYRELLWSAFGSFDESGAPQVTAFDKGGKVALLISGYTEDANRARGDRGVNPTWLRANNDNWRAFLRSTGATVYEVSDSDIESGNLDRYDLLVLPSATALSDAQIESIKAYMGSGRSVMASWTPGIYRPDGSWRGWSFIEEAFGVQATGFIEHGFTNFRVYTDTFPGVASPGLYRPIVGDISDETREARSNGATFGPLSGYRWADGLDAERPVGDFAIADTLTRYRAENGESIREVATRVQYFTWLGGDPSAAAEAATADAAFGRVTLLAGTPLSAGLQAPFRMKTGTFDAPLQLRAAEPRTRAAAFWHDFAASDQTSPDALSSTVAIAYGTYGHGRFIYLGHELSAMGFNPDEQSALARFFENSLRWLGRDPLAWIEKWPYDHTSAALIAGVGTGDASRLDGLLNVTDQKQAPATIYLGIDDIERHTALASRASTTAELGLLADASMSDLAMSNVRDRYTRSVGEAPRGFRSTARNTINRRSVVNLAEAGFDYAFPDTLGRSLAPEVRYEPSLVVMHRTARTDQHILSLTPAGTEDMRFDYIRDDIGRVETEGGLYTLLVHGDGFAQREHLPLVARTIEELRARNFWIADGRAITTWSLTRDGLGVHVERRGPRRVHVRVSNSGNLVAENAALAIDLGQAAERVRVRPELVGTPQPMVRLDNGNTRLTLIIDRLAPAQYRTYQIDLVPRSANGIESDQNLPFFVRR